MHRVVLFTSLIGVMLVAGGCGGLLDRNGQPASVRDYDSVIIEDVRVAPSIPMKHMAELVKGFLQVELLTSTKWLRGDEFDVEGFAQYVETYATSAGTLQGKPVKPAMTREQYAKQYAEKRKELEPHLRKPKGTRPLRLRVEITKLDFPEGVGQVVLGTKAEARAAVHVYGGSGLTPIGSTEVKVIDGLPGIPLLPIAIVTRAASNAIFDQYTRKHVMKLALELSQEIVEELDEAKTR